MEIAWDFFPVKQKNTKKEMLFLGLLNLHGYFAFTEVRSDDWNTVNAARWSGAGGFNQEVVLDSEIEPAFGFVPYPFYFSSQLGHLFLKFLIGYVYLFSY